jgi:hypothetical protein
MASSRFEQYKFGKRKQLAKARGRPVPKFDKIEEERKRQARIRAVGDAAKRMTFEINPKARIWSIYGMAIINGQRQKFSFDVVWDNRDYTNHQIYEIKKAVYDRLYKGQIPKNYYYQFFLDPSHLLRGKWIEHEGIIEIAQVSKRKGVRGKFDSWRPEGRKYKEEEKGAERVAKMLISRERARRRIRQLA